MITLQYKTLEKIQRELCHKGPLHIKPYIGKWKLLEPNVSIEMRQSVGWRIPLRELNRIIQSELPYMHVLEDILDDTDPQYAVYRYVIVPREITDLKAF